MILSDLQAAERYRRELIAERRRSRALAWWLAAVAFALVFFTLCVLSAEL